MTLKAYFLGQLNFLYKGKPISDKLSLKAQGLLCYLIMNQSQYHNREHLAEIFWESSSKDSAKYNLRYTLWSIRKSLESSAAEQKFILLPAKNECSFNSSSKHWVDVFEFIKLVEQGKNKDLATDERINCLEQASTLYKSDFLEGIHIRASSAFSDWVFYEKERLQKLFFESQMTLAKLYEKNNRFKKAINALKRLILINPLHEEIYYRLINLHYKSGDRASAVKVFLKCKKTLREELNISPMVKTQQLYKKILEECNYQMEFPNNEKSPIVLAKQSLKKPELFKNTGISMIFYNTATNQHKTALEKQLRALSSEREFITLEIARTPGHRIPFEGIMEIDEKINEYKNQAQVPLCDLEKVKDPLDCYNIYQSLYAKLKNLSHKKRVLISIYNIQWLDKETIDFISFLYRKGYNDSITIIGLYDLRWKNSRFESFREIFFNETRVSFHNCLDKEDLS